MHCCLIRRSLVLLIAWASWTPSLTACENTDATAATDADTPAAAEESVQRYKLAYVFTTGQVVHLASEFQAQMSVRFKEAKQVDKNSSKLWKHYTVISVAPDGTGTLELQLDKAHQQVQFGDNPPEIFKSDDPKYHHRKFRDTLAKIGHPTAVIDYSPQGKLLQVVEPSGDKKIAPRKRPPQDHQGFLIPLPAEPVAVGDTWKDPFQQEVGIKGGLKRAIDMVRVYELESVEGDLAKISFKTSILTPVNNEEILAQLSQRQTEGTITFDMQKGLIVAKLITVNESVVNAFGEGTSLHTATKLTESVASSEVVAEKVQPASAETK